MTVSRGSSLILNCCTVSLADDGVWDKAGGCDASFPNGSHDSADDNWISTDDWNASYNQSTRSLWCSVKEAASRDRLGVQINNIPSSVCCKLYVVSTRSVANPSVCIRG